MTSGSSDPSKSVAESPAPAGLDLSNWRTSPRNRWSFRNVGRVLDVVTVENDPATVRTLEPAARVLDGSILQTLFLSATATDAIVVLHHGKIAFEAYANGNDERTPHIMMSATKAVTGLLAALLEHGGLIDLGAPVARYVPEVAASVFAGASLRELLDMRTGVVLPAPLEALYGAAAGWDPLPPGAHPGGLHDFLTHVPGPNAAHGGPFSYVSANTDLAGWAMERATGTPFATLASDWLWKPLGAEHPALLTVDAEGAPRCAGGLCATVRDFARIGQLLIDGGRASGTEIVPEAVVADLERGGDAAAWRDGQWGKAFAPISKNMRYRNGWYAIADEPKTLFAMGIHGQNLFVDRTNEIVIAKFSSWSASTDYVALPLTHLAVGRIRHLLTS